MDLRIQLDNKLNVPLGNFEEFNLDFSFDEFSPNPNVLADFMPEFYATKDDVDGYNFILDYMRDNPKQNMPAPVVDLDSGLQIQNTFLDLNSASNEFDFKQNRIKVELSTYANAFFRRSENLSLKTFYGPERFVRTRYVRNKVPDYLESAMLSFAIYVTVQQTIQIFRDTIDQVRAAIARSATDLGVFVNVSLVILGAALYLSLILIALYQLLKDFSEAIFGKPRAYYAVDWFDVLRKGCEYLGFTFSSTDLAKLEGLTFLAATSEKGELRKTPTNNPLPDITLLEFFRWAGMLINAKLKVRTDQRIVEFEQKTTFEQNPSDLTLGDIWNKGTFHFDSAELNNSIKIKFLNAFQDGNITDNQFEVSFIDIKRDSALTAVENHLSVDMPFAVGVPKTETKPLEKHFNGIFDILTGINKDAKLDIAEREGLLLLETDVVPNHLVYFRDEQKLDFKTTSKLSAKSIFSDYYQIETPFENQWKTQVSRGREPVLNKDTVIQIINNNIARNEDGRIVYLTKNVKNSRTDLHEFEYKQKLEHGDLNFVSANHFIINVIEDSTPKVQKKTFKEFLEYLVS